MVALKLDRKHRVRRRRTVAVLLSPATLALLLGFVVAAQVSAQTVGTRDPVGTSAPEGPKAQRCPEGQHEGRPPQTGGEPKADVDN